MNSRASNSVSRPALRDDMDEWPGFLPAGAKRACDTLVETYRDADATAVDTLRSHRIAVGLSAVLGTAAVAIAIIELARHAKGTEGVVWLVLEGVAALGVGAVVIWGWRSALKSTWLLERHKAERCRFRKYHFLLDVALTSDADRIRTLAAALEADALAFRKLEEPDMLRWMEEDPVPEPQPPASSSRIVRENLLDLAAHYAYQRLEGQADYFFKQSKRNVESDDRYKHIPLIFFFLSILIALTHFALPAAAKLLSIHEELNTEWMVAVAAILPVLGAGIRLWRSAFEFARNTIRFRAKAAALNVLVDRVRQQLRPDHELVASEIVRDMWSGELILEEEHREWLRLMQEAEWIG